MFGEMTIFSLNLYLRQLTGSSAGLASAGGEDGRQLPRPRRAWGASVGTRRTWLERDKGEDKEDERHSRSEELLVLEKGLHPGLATTTGAGRDCGAKGPTAASSPARRAVARARVARSAHSLPPLGYNNNKKIRR